MDKEMLEARLDHCIKSYKGAQNYIVGSVLFVILGGGLLFLGFQPMWPLFYLFSGFAGIAYGIKKRKDYSVEIVELKKKMS